MERISRRFLLGWILGVALALVLSATSVAIEPAESTPDVGAAPPAAVTVIGKVEAAPSDDDGMRLVEIVDGEERVLIVDDVGAGRALAKHTGEQVSAMGVVSLRKDGREVIRISSFRPL